MTQRQTTIADFYPSFVDEVYQFNQQAGLLANGYSDYLESSFQIEEALEGFDLRGLYATLNRFSPDATSVAITSPELASTLSAKLVSRTITGQAMGLSEYSTPDDLRKSILSDVDRLDKHIDSIIFSIGSIAKLGLTPQQIATAISIVTTANLQKLSMPKDEFGKLTKPADFIGPEAQLQALLDARQVS